MPFIFTVTITLLECLPVIFFFTNFLPYPLTRRQKSGFYFFYLLLHITLFNSYGQSMAPLIFLLSILSVALFDRQHFIYNLIFSSLGYLYGVCINYIVLAFLGLLSIPMEVIQTNYAIIFCIIFSIFSWFATYFPGKVVRKKILALEINFSKKLVFLIMMEIFICISIFILNITVGESIGYPAFTLLWSSLLFIFFFTCTALILILVIKTTKENALVQAKLKEFEALKYYITQIETLYETLNQIHHDYPNILLSLRSFIEEEDIPALKNYFFTNITPFHKKVSSMDSILKYLTNIKCIELKSILYTKLVIAHEQNINISLIIPEVVTGGSLQADSLDLVRIMGIFLDNAIEAAAETQPAFLEVTILPDENSVTITISNSCSVKEVPLDIIYHSGTSSKGASRGIGLHSANQIISRYPKILLTTKSADFCFIQELIFLS